MFFLFSASAAVMESVGTYKVTVIRHGKLDSTVRVRYVECIFHHVLIVNQPLSVIL